MTTCDKCDREFGETLNSKWNWREFIESKDGTKTIVPRSWCNGCCDKSTGKCCLCSRSPCDVAAVAIKNSIKEWLCIPCALDRHQDVEQAGFTIKKGVNYYTQGSAQVFTSMLIIMKPGFASPRQIIPRCESCSNSCAATVMQRGTSEIWTCLRCSTSETSDAIRLGYVAKPGH
jgi:hypothetical protein